MSRPVASIATFAWTLATWSTIEAGPVTLTVSGVTTAGLTSRPLGVGPWTTLTGMPVRVLIGSSVTRTSGGSQLTTWNRGSTDSTLTGTNAGAPFGSTSLRSTVARKLSDDARAPGSEIDR